MVTQVLCPIMGWKCLAFNAGQQIPRSELPTTLACRLVKLCTGSMEFILFACLLLFSSRRSRQSVFQRSLKWIFLLNRTQPSGRDQIWHVGRKRRVFAHLLGCDSTIFSSGWMSASIYVGKWGADGSAGTCPDKLFTMSKNQKFQLCWYYTFMLRGIMENEGVTSRADGDISQEKDESSHRWQHTVMAHWTEIWGDNRRGEFNSDIYRADGAHAMTIFCFAFNFNTMYVRLCVVMTTSHHTDQSACQSDKFLPHF